MRKLFVPLLAVLLFGTSAISAAEPAALTPTQVSRLESLCRVWGVVKFFHPWIVAPPDGKPIDWDAALIETIPLVEAASSPEDFRGALDHMLAALHDSATRAVIPAPHQERVERPPVEPALPETKLVESGEKKFLVITATDWRRLGADQRKYFGGLFWDAFAKAADADAIVLDLRRQDTPPPISDGDKEGSILGNGLRSDLAALLKADLTLAAVRSRFHSGYASEQGGTSGGYLSGFSIAEHSVLRAWPGPGAGKRLVILTNAGTRGLTSVFAALQSSGQGVVLHDSPNLSNFADSETYSMRLADGVVAKVRMADLVNADGAVGFVPDIISTRESGATEDTLMNTALAVARGETTPAPRQLRRLPAAPVRPAENAYPEMTAPSREYRLLGLFRVWNVMHYFFPYKHLMDYSWDSVLTEFIPRFAQADDARNFGLAVHEFVAHLQDSHVYARGGAAEVSPSDHLLGRARPMIALRALRGELVVSTIDASLEGRVKVQRGDTVLAVDGEAIGERIARLKKYYAASTPQALLRTLQPLILHGPEDSQARLTLRGQDGTVREERVPRQLEQRRPGAGQPRPPQALPSYRVLPEGYGYFNLVRLTVTEVDAAFEAVKDTPALIMDMRGYPQGTGWAICARLTDKPMTMAMFHRPYLISPEPNRRFDSTFLQRIEPGPLWKYTGRVVVLINENAISQSEHSCLGFEEAAKGRITFIGTPTTGANGDVTSTSMPGGIRISFSGHDVRHADGRQLQRKGIQPDIVVEPTIAGIVARKDELLPSAIRFLDESMGK